MALFLIVIQLIGKAFLYLSMVVRNCDSYKDIDKRDTGKRYLTDLANSCKWLAEKRLGDITKR